MRGRRRSGWLLLLVGCAAGCATPVPDPPPPLVVEAAPTLEPPSVHPTYVWIRPQNQPVDGLAPPALPLLPVRVRVEPARPAQASVVTIHVEQPPGPPLEGPRARVSGRPVRLAPAASGWVGVAGLPLDSAGFHQIEIEYARGGRAAAQATAFRIVPRTYPSRRIRIRARGGGADPEVEARIERERRLIQEALGSSVASWYPSTPFGWPRPPIKTSPFGQRRVFDGDVQSRHLGLDLRGRYGEPVVAPAAARVLLTGDFFYQGNAVYLDHGLGLVTAYFHFSSIDVEPGEIVAAGQRIGRVGSTGRSTAPHLHWSAYVEGANVDPESLIGLALPLEGAASSPVDRSR